MSERPTLETKAENADSAADAAPDQTFSAGESFPIRADILRRVDRRGANRRRVAPSGRRQDGDGSGALGHTIGSRPLAGEAGELAVSATLRAAALRHARLRIDSSDTAAAADRRTRLTKDDLRVKVRRPRTGSLILFVVDASGSMGARKRMVAVKGAILSLLLDAYQRRDRVGMIAFRGVGAKVLVAPTNSVELAERSLRQLPTGGRTPLAAGLELAEQLLEQSERRPQALDPLLILITDGRSNQGAPPERVAQRLAAKQRRILVLDTEDGYVRMGLAARLAALLQAPCLPLDDLRAEVIQRHVRQALDRS